MKIARFFAVIFAVLGIVLMLGTAIVCFASTDAKVKLTKTPEGAVLCAERLAGALDAGDLEAAGELLYGSPDLGAEGIPSDAVEAMLWDAYLEGFSCNLEGKLYLKDSEFAWDGTVTSMDLAALTEAIQLRAKELLEEKVKAATDMAELYDAENNFREDLIEQVILTAVQESLAGKPETVTRSFTLKLINRDGQWWAVPDQQLLSALKISAA